MKKLLVLLLASGFLACSDSNRTNSERENKDLDVQTSYAGEQYRIEPEKSTVKWRGQKVTGSFHTGTVGIAEGRIGVEASMIKGGDVTIDMTKMVITNIDDQASNRKLYGHLQGPDFFDVMNHPSAGFSIATVSEDSIKANLTIKGITHPISIPYTMEINEGILTAHAVFEVDRAKYDVRYGSGSFFENLGDNLIEDMIKFEVDLVASIEANQ